MNRIAVDIGGTFTDCLVSWEDRTIESKALTTHYNLSNGFNEAVDSACAQLGVAREQLFAKVDSIRYATTLGTNAIIERKGPKIGLLVTHGFEATVAISRGRGYGEGLDLEKVRDLSSGTRPDPLVPIHRIRGVRERMTYDGKAVFALDEEDVRRCVRELVDQGVEALVVCLTNAVTNPAHEQRVQEIIREDFPGYMLGAIPVILSHQVSGRKGEYARASSAIIDAYLHATMYHAMSVLELNLRDAGYPKPMLLVHNSGGMAQLNSTDALQTVHSGPVAGVNASEQLSLQGSLGNIVATDMGGTSFDIGMIVEGGYKHYDFTPVIDRWLVTLPMVHLNTLGSGGGSIAKYDRVFKTVKVGPESAGSQPGPACYDKGGLNPTVTDVDLLLGYLAAENYADGHIQLSAKRSRMVLEDLCDELDMEEIEVARLIRDTVDRDMAMGILRELRSRGYRAEEFTMLAYGGNGPLHACGIAEKAGITKVLVPPYSAVFSACGAACLQSLHFHERTRTVALYNSDEKTIFDDYDSFNEIVTALEARGRADLARQGIAPERVQHRLELDVRYGSQKIETALALDKTRISDHLDVLGIIEKLATDFERRYGKGTPAPETGVWVATFRVASYVPTEPIQFEDTVPPKDKLHPPEPVGRRVCHFVGQRGSSEVPVYDAAALEPGMVIQGPAIVNPGHTTYLVEPNWRMEVGGQRSAWFLRNESEDSGVGGNES
ncbi:MAG: hydantoinase/oxoprolinase family protein [Polyangiales bacterium]